MEINIKKKKNGRMLLLMVLCIYPVGQQRQSKTSRRMNKGVGFSCDVYIRKEEDDGWAPSSMRHHHPVYKTGKTK